MAAVDLAGDERESDLAVTLHEIEQQVNDYPAIQRAVLTLSAPGAEALVVE